MARPISLFIPILFSSFLNAQTPELTGILKRLDRLERQNQELMEELRSLRAELGAAHPAASRAPAVSELPQAPASQARLSPAPGPPLSGGSEPAPGQAGSVPSSSGGQESIEDRLEIQEHRIEEQAQSKVEASQKFPIRLTGMALFNGFLNSHQSGGADYPTFASAPGPGHDGATVRQTILGLDFRGPETIGGGHVHGSVYMDFASGSLPLSQTVRLRTASIGIDWGATSILAGQEKPIFNPREPSSLAQVAVSPLAGAGNLWLWIPQIRVGQNFSFGTRDGLNALIGIVQTREVGAYAGSPVGGGVELSRPGLEGRFEFFHKIDDERRLELAPGFHVSSTHVDGFSVPSQLISMDWFFNPVRLLELSGAWYRGQNVAPLGTGGIRQGFGLYADHAEAVHSQGGWAQLTVHALRRLDFHFFSGQQDDHNSNLVSGSIGKNLVFGANVYFRIAPNVLVGWETTHTRTVYLPETTRINNHYDLALGYLF